MNSLPALLIGGPPHAGKSVLFYSLTHALRQRGVPHHAIRACPDGEGNWSQEADQEVVRLLRIKGDWTDEFTERVCRDIEQRLLPMLIDMGGKPQGTQLQIFGHCTHSLLLLRPDDPESILRWRTLVEENGLLPLAQLYSQLHGTEAITSTFPVIEGTLAGLERHTPVQGPLFDLLVERIAALFGSYSSSELENTLLSRAPTELVLRLPQLLRTLFPGATRWEPAMLPRLLSELPQQTPLSVYGQAPHWLYGTLIAFVGSQPFYQFDPRRGESGGWIAPPSLCIGTPSSPDVAVSLSKNGQVQKLTVEIVKKHLDYLQAETLTFPAVEADAGLILDGSMPSWLLTALVRLYAETDVAWLACHYPPLHKAIVVAARGGTYAPGDLVPMP
jgi:CRISPR-associated protein Csx3